jgi:uncharacterized membrane-anchored protein
MKNVMKKLNVRFALFALFAAACVYAPLSIVWKYENTLRHGVSYKFRTKPVDPYDAFRGRYVTLAFEDEFLETPEDKQAEAAQGNLAYVRLAVDGDGFAMPVEVSQSRIAGDDVITVDYAYRGISWQNNKRHGWRLVYPFSRYYLPEDIAPEAEKLYMEANRRVNNATQETQKMPAYVTVRVRNGVGVIEELYINGKPVRDAVRDALGKK